MHLNLLQAPCRNNGKEFLLLFRFEQIFSVSVR